MEKREFLKLLGVGLGAAIVDPMKAAAERGRILRSDPTDFAATGASPEFRRFLGGVRTGDARAHGALLVFWLHGGIPAPYLPITTLAEARSRGDLLITERPQPTVPDLIVDNRGKTHVLLLAGEILLGGKQNRIVTEDILLPPFSGPVSIGVYCVEQGRWSGASSSFSGRDVMAARGLREKVMEKADQRQVWAEVKKYAGRAGAASPTDNYQAIYDKPEVKAHQQEVEHSIPAPAPAAVGAAVFVGEKLSGLDLFQDPGLLALEWPKLLRAHALDTYGLPAPGKANEPPLRARLADLLGRAAKVEGSLRRNVGVGQLFEFRVEAFRGSALVAEDQVVHAAIL